MDRIAMSTCHGEFLEQLPWQFLKVSITWQTCHPPNSSGAAGWTRPAWAVRAGERVREGSTALGMRGNGRGEARGAHRGGTRRPGGGLGAAGWPDLKERRRDLRWKKGSMAGSRCSSARLRSGSSTYPTETM